MKINFKFWDQQRPNPNDYQLIAEISAASILAKVTRDLEMEDHHKEFPHYGFNQHKGYPTAQHIAALKEYGPSNLHRKSYKPVRDALALIRQSVFISP